MKKKHPSQGWLPASKYERPAERASGATVNHELVSRFFVPRDPSPRRERERRASSRRAPAG
jgi:hypothetical protein